MNVTSEEQCQGGFISVRQVTDLFCFLSRWVGAWTLKQNMKKSLFIPGLLSAYLPTWAGLYPTCSLRYVLEERLWLLFLKEDRSCVCLQ